MEKFEQYLTVAKKFLTCGCFNNLLYLNFTEMKRHCFLENIDAEYYIDFMI